MEARRALMVAGGSATRPARGEQAPPRSAGEGAPEEEALAEEAAHLERLSAELARRHPGEAFGPRRREPFGLALSGGGTRASAFHCGVFWALSAAGLLKEVQHLCAVSGGGYTAASYVTHVCRAACGSPPGEQGLDAWYARVTARFVLRMQRNISYLADISPGNLWRHPRDTEPEEEGSTCCPRVLDIPLLVGAVLAQMTASPVLLAVQTLWPIVLCLEMVHGAWLRAAWCSPSHRLAVDAGELHDWLLGCLFVGACLAVASMVLGSLRCLRVFPRTAEQHRRYLFTRSLQHVVNRWLICYALQVLLVGYALWIQSSRWGAASDASESEPTSHAQWVRALCYHYASGSGASPATCSDCQGDLLGAPGLAWYETGANSLYLNTTWAREHASWAWSPPAGAPPAGAGVPYPGWPPGSGRFAYAAASLGVSGIVLVSAGALLWRNALLKLVFTAVGPLCYFFLVGHVARWKIFGPITSQVLVPSLHFSHEAAAICLWVFTAGALLTLPMYDAFQKLAHMYYRRALKRAFFDGGQDVEFSAIASNPYCPNLLFGACVHDYRKPWEDANHCQFTMSSLHIGCARTGFFGTPANASLARLMTIAGAATDATFLLYADVLAIRFFLAVVALRFGDFLRLEPEGPMCTRVQTRVLDAYPLNQSFPMRDQHVISRWLQGLLDRLPAACVFILAHILLLIGATVGMGSGPGSASACLAYKALLSAMVLVASAVAALSFFAHMKPLEWLMRSPMIQQMLMLCMHRHTAVRPPPYLYISDGGLLEVLGVLPLLRRRLGRIVASDAAEDPELSMRCLRDTLAICRAENLCSFYDPRDPRRDMEFVLRDFREGTEPFLHLGIRYEPQAPESEPAAVDGELFYVRMRMPPGDGAPVRPLLAEAELLSAPGAPAAAGPGAALRRDFGGACCPASECGGLCAGRRFPHFGVSNQFLTPLHFANLCGLGGEASRPLVQAMLRGRSSRRPASSAGPL